MSILKKLLNSNYIKIRNIINKLNDDNISEYAAECAFFTILSFIPCIIFFLSLVRYTNIDEATIFFSLKEFIPNVTYEFVVGIIDEVYSKSFGTISLSAVVALWSAGKGFFSLCKGFRKIYNTEKNTTKIWIRIQGVIYTFIFIIIVIMALIILVFGNSIHKMINGKFKLLTVITSYILKLRFLFTIFILFLIFAFLYKIVSNKKIGLKYQIPGALFSSVGWYISSLLFSVYVDIFKGFTNMYGSLSNIILIMMWMYVCIYIVLLGAEINSIYFNKKNIKLLDQKLSSI